MTAGLTGFWMGLRPLQSSSPTAFGATPALAACAASVVAEVSPSVSVALTNSTASPETRQARRSLRMPASSASIIIDQLRSTDTTLAQDLGLREGCAAGFRARFGEPRSADRAGDLAGQVVLRLVVLLRHGRPGRGRLRGGPDRGRGEREARSQAGERQHREQVPVVEVG